MTPMQSMKGGAIVVGALMAANILAAVTILVLGLIAQSWGLGEHHWTWVVVALCGVTVGVLSLTIPIQRLSRPPRPVHKG